MCHAARPRPSAGRPSWEDAGEDLHTDWTPRRNLSWELRFPVGFGSLSLNLCSLSFTHRIAATRAQSIPLRLLPASLQTRNHLMGESEIAQSKEGHGKQIYKKGRPKVKFEDLDNDVLCTILSKLPPKEAVRTSVLSSSWRCLWTICTRLSFNGIEMFGGNRTELKHSTQKFIDNVNAVLQQCRGRAIEELEIKFDFDSMPVTHLNEWVRFAISSRTKSLALDLLPAKYSKDGDRYIFPCELLEGERISRIQCIQLSCVSLKPSAQFRGFQNLKKLDLYLLDVARNDLEDMLSNCYNLEWLSIIRCHLDDELIVDRPLSCLLHLQIIWCEITKIQFLAVKLATFIYNGDLVPIFLNRSSKLERVEICFSKAFLQPAFTGLFRGLPNIQNLCLRFESLKLENQLLWDRTFKFSYLRHLQLLIFIPYKRSGKILNLSSILCVTPSIEMLEVHYDGWFDSWFSKEGHARDQHQQHKLKYLKNMYMTGYKAAKGQLEFILHVVENAPALEVLTVEITQKASEDFWADKIHETCFERAGRHARYRIAPKLSSNVKFCVMI